MNSTRRRFGPLTYATVAVALVLVASVRGWPMMIEQWQAWSYARQLRDPKPGEREVAIQGLVGLGTAAWSWVVRATRDPNPMVREAAVSMILRLDPDHPNLALDALIAAFRDGDPKVRETAIYQVYVAAGSFARQADPVSIDRLIDGLRGALDDPVQSVRTWAVSALGSLGPTASRAAADLERVMTRYADATTRRYAAQSLLSIVPPGSTARLAVVASLRKMLADPEMMQAREGDRICWLLRSEIGDEQTAAVLIPLLDQPVQHSALGLLTLFPPETPGVRAALVGALANDSATVRTDAAFHLLKVDRTLTDPALAVVIDQLVFLRDGGYFAWDIIRSLRSVAPDLVQPVTARLIDEVERADRVDQRPHIIEALGVIGPPEVIPAVPSLRAIINKADRSVALPAIEALVKIDRLSASEFLPRLIGWIQPVEAIDTRMAAMRTLGELGPLARDAIPALLPLTDEEDFQISAAAIATITQIDPEHGARLKQAIIENH